MAEEDNLPLLNPVLSLQMEPAPESRIGGGKGQHSVVNGRLDEQREKLSGKAQALHASRAEFVTFDGKTLLTVCMFPDSLAPSHTPTDLFAAVHGCRFMAPLAQGLPRRGRTRPVRERCCRYPKSS